MFVSELIDEAKKKKQSKFRRRSKKFRFFDMALSKENLTGLILALVSSGFIGSSFIIKKQGLRRAAAVSGVRAGQTQFLVFFSSSSAYLNVLIDLHHFCRCWWILLSLGATLVGGVDHK